MIETSLTINLRWYQSGTTPSHLILTRQPKSVVNLLGSSSLDTRYADVFLSESFLTMLATEEVLSRDWDSPEEDEAWAHL